MAWGAIGGAVAGAVISNAMAPDMPSAPDQTGLAYQQYLDQLNLNRSQTAANRPTQISPYGQVTWQQDPNNPDQWTQTTTLSPSQQDIFNAQQRAGINVANQFANYANQPLQLPGAIPTLAQNPNALPTYGADKQAVMNAELARVNDQYNRDVESKKAQLAAQGIPPGSEAYNREMDTLNRQLTDARQQAAISATNMAGQDYSSAIAGRQQFQTEAMNQYNTGMKNYLQNLQNTMTLRELPLTELNTLQSGAVTSPNFSSFSSMPGTSAPDLVSAAQNNYANAINQYNAGVAQANQTGNAIGQAWGAYMNRPSTPTNPSTTTYRYQPMSYQGMGVMNPYNANNPYYING